MKLGGRKSLLADMNLSKQNKKQVFPCLHLHKYSAAKSASIFSGRTSNFSKSCGGSLSEQTLLGSCSFWETPHMFENDIVGST